MDGLTTERLLLRPFRPEDLPVYAELNADPRVAEWLSGPLTPAESDEIALWANERWAADRRGRLAHEHWGHGYATEAGRAWLAYGFETLGLDRIVSMTDEANTRSLAVMRRLGLTYLENDVITDNGVTFDSVIYAITRSQWAEHLGR